PPSGASPSHPGSGAGSWVGAARPVPSRRPPVRSAWRDSVTGDWQLTRRPPGLVQRPLATDAELGDQRAVTLDVVVPHVVEQPAPPTDQLHEPPPGVVITLVGLEVLGQ